MGLTTCGGIISIHSLTSLLGEQKSLQALILGHVYSRSFCMCEPCIHRQCLEMTLESGLDMMAGLAELMMVQVSNMLHHIGVLELEWMHANWPKLILIDGMFRTCVDPISGAHEWIQDNQKDWVHETDLDRYFA